MKLSRERIAELRKLMAEAAQGPWDTSVDGRGTAVFGDGDMVTLCRHVCDGKRARKNAALIAAMRNALPGLLAIADAAAQIADAKGHRNLHPEQTQEPAVAILFDRRAWAEFVAAAGGAFEVVA